MEKQHEQYPLTFVEKWVEDAYLTYNQTHLPLVASSIARAQMDTSPKMMTVTILIGIMVHNHKLFTTKTTRPQSQ